MKNISSREQAEMKLALNNRFIFLAGLRYIRDNWISKAENQISNTNTTQTSANIPNSNFPLAS